MIYNKIFVKNIPPGVHPSYIRQLYAQHNALKVEVPANMNGCAIVTFHTEAEARQAVHNSAHLRVGNHDLHVALYIKPRRGKRKWGRHNTQSTEELDEEDAIEETPLFEQASPQKGPDVGEESLNRNTPPVKLESAPFGFSNFNESSAIDGDSLLSHFNRKEASRYKLPLPRKTPQTKYPALPISEEEQDLHEHVPERTSSEAREHSPEELQYSSINDLLSLGKSHEQAKLVAGPAHKIAFSHDHPTPGIALDRKHGPHRPLAFHIERTLGAEAGSYPDRTNSDRTKYGTMSSSCFPARMTEAPYFNGNKTIWLRDHFTYSDCPSDAMSPVRGREAGQTSRRAQRQENTKQDPQPPTEAVHTYADESSFRPTVGIEQTLLHPEDHMRPLTALLQNDMRQSVYPQIEHPLYHTQFAPQAMSQIPAHPPLNPITVDAGTKHQLHAPNCHLCQRMAIWSADPKPTHLGERFASTMM